MRVAFVINDVQTEGPKYTTVLLAHRMHNQGHDVFFIGVGEMEYFADGQVGGRGRRVTSKRCKNPETYLKALQGDKAEEVRIAAHDLDVLFLRNDPSAESPERSWARSAGTIFGQLAARQGVVVLNDPFSLADAMNKMYFQSFPEEVRPKTIITRSAEEIRNFYEEQQDHIILKPLQGSGGKNVFMVEKDSGTNLNQIIEVISREGYIIAQEYIPEAKKGDVRVFLMNGRLLEHEGKYAALRRYNENDIRSNMHAGGEPQKAEITDEIFELAELIRPKLVQDGMFLVGIDVVGSKLLEVNVFSPGGLCSCNELEGVDFTAPIIEALEEKVRYKNTYSDKLHNKVIAAL